MEEKKKFEKFITPWKIRVIGKNENPLNTRRKRGLLGGKRND